MKTSPTATGHSVGRLLIEAEPLDGPTNMARDELLLTQADRDDTIAVRWYRWSPATLSLGYFQDDDPAIRPELPRVRRLSGGGAIVHDNEWTYSIAAPRAVFPNVRELYATVHGAIVETLREHQLDVRFRGVARPEIDGAFLCFSRGDEHDIVATSVDGRSETKLVGSAQRRRGTAVLQHGSIALDVAAPVIGNSSERRPVHDVLDFNTFTTKLTKRLSTSGNFPQTQQSQWNLAETDYADRWSQQKYGLIDWPRPLRRGPENAPRADS